MDDREPLERPRGPAPPRSDRREPIFFEDGDQDVYCDRLAEQTGKAGVAVWAYCLMTNHVHLILTPNDEADLAGQSANATGVTPPSSTPGPDARTG